MTAHQDRTGSTADRSRANHNRADGVRNVQDLYNIKAAYGEIGILALHIYIGLDSAIRTIRRYGDRVIRVRDIKDGERTPRITRHVGIMADHADRERIIGGRRRDEAQSSFKQIRYVPLHIQRRLGIVRADADLRG